MFIDTIKEVARISRIQDSLDEFDSSMQRNPEIGNIVGLAYANNRLVNLYSD